jgi:hypothetical protein
MKRAAIGIRMHSGWGALVAVSYKGGTVEIVERRRIALITPDTPGSKQPYHFVEKFELSEADKFIAARFADSKRLALGAVRDVITELKERKYRLVGSAIVLASGRPLPPLAKILTAHPMLHAAEGEFFRQAFSKACEGLKLTWSGVRERDLDQCLRKMFGETATRIKRQISTFGRSLGPPWTTDQKTAALAALLVLGKK